MGGFSTPTPARIGGTESAPSIPVANSPTSGIFKTPDGGVGVAIGGHSYAMLNAVRALFGRTSSIYTLSPLAGSPFAGGGANPYQFDLSPSGTLIALCNYGANTISVFNISVLTGALSAVAGSPFAAGGSAPITMVFSPNGKILAVGNYNSNTVSVFTVNQITGALTLVAGTPIACGVTPRSIAFSPDGRFLLCACEGSNSIYNYSCDVDTGVTVLLNTLALGSSPTALDISPDGRMAVTVGIASSDTILISRNTTTGALAKTNTITTAGAGAFAVRFSNGGSRLFVGNNSSASCAVYTVDTVLCSAVPVAGSPFACGSNPTSIDVARDDTHVAISLGGANNSVEVMTIDTNGALARITGSPFATGGQGSICTRYSPDGSQLIVSNYTTANLSIFSTLSGGTDGLVTFLFDPAGGLNGSVNVNGNVYSLGELLLTDTLAAQRYAKYAGGATIPTMAGGAGKFLATDGAAFKWSGVTQALPAVMVANAGAVTIDDSGMYVVDVTGALTAAGALTGTLTYPTVPVHITFHNNTTGNFPLVLNAAATIPRGTSDWYWNGATFHMEGAEAFRTDDVTPLAAAGAVVAVNHLCATNALIAGLEVVCLTAEFGYTAGDVVQAIEQSTGAAADSLCLWINTTQVGFTLAALNALAAHDKATGAQVVLTAANWAYRFRIQP